MDCVGLSGLQDYFEHFGVNGKHAAWQELTRPNLQALAIAACAQVCMVFETMGPNVLALIKRPGTVGADERSMVLRAARIEGTTSRAYPWILCAR